MYNINGYELSEAGLEKLTLPCLLIDVGETPLQSFQKDALDKLVVQSKPTRENMQVGLAYIKRGKVAWGGSLMPDRIRFILSLLEHLDTHILTEEHGVIAGTYIDAYIRSAPVEDI